jgi:hypothetical protein
MVDGNYRKGWGTVATKNQTARSLSCRTWLAREIEEALVVLPQDTGMPALVGWLLGASGLTSERQREILDLLIARDHESSPASRDAAFARLRAHGVL